MGPIAMSAATTPLLHRGTRAEGLVDGKPAPKPGGRGLFALAAGIALVRTLSPTYQIGDSRLSATVAWQFLRHGNLYLESYPHVMALADHYDVTVVDGHVVPYFPWPTMLLAIPGELICFLLGKSPDAVSISDPSRTFLIEAPMASILVAITALIVRRIVLDTGRVRSAGAALLVTLVFAFGTSAWSVGSRALWQQTASMLVVSIMVLAMTRLEGRRRWPLILGAMSAVAFAVRPTNAVVIVLVLVWVAVRHRSMLLRVALAGVAASVPFFVVSVANYGTLLPPYYVAGRLAGARAIPPGESPLLTLVSPSRGFLLYDPVVIIAIVVVVARLRSGRRDMLDVVLGLAIVGQWLVIADFGSTGGHTYGPRLMLDVVPFAVILAAPALDRLVVRTGVRDRLVVAGSVGAIVTVLIVGGLFVNATGAVARAGMCWNVTPVAVDEQPSRIWDWSDTQFLRPYRDLAQGRSLREVLIGGCRDG